MEQDNVCASSLSYCQTIKEHVAVQKVTTEKNANNVKCVHKDLNVTMELLAMDSVSLYQDTKSQ
jgi:hypothetical protein